MFEQLKIQNIKILHLQDSNLQCTFEMKLKTKLELGQKWTVHGPWSLNGPGNITEQTAQSGWEDWLLTVFHLCFIIPFQGLTLSPYPTVHFKTNAQIDKKPGNKPSAQRIVSRIIKKESDHSEAFCSLKRFKKETSRPGNGARINETKKL